MISEKHDDISIYHWLSIWLKCDVPPPKEVCYDMSLALLSTLVWSFTLYSSLYDYINVCSRLLEENITSNSFWLRRYFIRINIAHFIKNITKRQPFLTVSKRVKEVYIRAICLIIKSQSLDKIHTLLHSIFIVASNETDELHILCGFEIQCEVHKKKLLEKVSYGINDF